jgi:hypothetical protein
MKTNEQYQSNQSFGLLLLGPPKSGKTNAAMIFPNPYFADCDNNLSSAVNRCGDKTFYYDTINIDDEGKEVPEGFRYERLLQCCKAAANNPDVQTIVVDSLTMVGDYIIAHILRKQNIPQMRIQDYGTLKDLASKFIVWLRSSGKLIIFTGHEKYDKDEISGVLLYRVNFPGQLADTIGAYFSDVWRCECEQSGGDKYKYIVRTMPTPRMALGNSLGLPTTFELSWDRLKTKLQPTKLQSTKLTDKSCILLKSSSKV